MPMMCAMWTPVNCCEIESETKFMIFCKNKSSFSQMGGFADDEIIFIHLVILGIFG